MKRAIYPGSFDPLTYGHLDVIRKASKLTDELIVGVLKNNQKIALFSIKERVRMIEGVVQNMPNVKVVPFEGLLVDFARETGADSIIRGLRAITDFEYELQMSQMNHKLYPELETLFLSTSLKYSYLSSTIVKEVASYGGDVSQFVPPQVADLLKEKIIKKERTTDEQSN